MKRVEGSEGGPGQEITKSSRSGIEIIIVVLLAKLSSGMCWQAYLFATIKDIQLANNHLKTWKAAPLHVVSIGGIYYGYFI